MGIQGGLAALAAMAVLAPAAAADPPLHYKRFTVTDRHPVTRRLARAKDIELVSVRVGSDQLVFGDQLGDNTALMYGDGVVLRFHQSGVRQTVHAAAVVHRANVSIAYRVLLPVG